MMRIAAVISVVACGTATAQVTAQPLSICLGRTDEEVAIDDAVTADAMRAPDWNFWWSFGFVAAAVGVIVVGDVVRPDWISERTRVGLHVTAAKATVGALGRSLFQLDVGYERRCLDERRQPPGMQRALVARAARAERKTFWMSLAGGLTLNTAGLLYLGLARDDWRTGAITFASGTVVSVLTLWSLPHRAWSQHRKLGVVPIRGGLAIVGAW